MSQYQEHAVYAPAFFQIARSLFAYSDIIGAVCYLVYERIFEICEPGRLCVRISLEQGDAPVALIFKCGISESFGYILIRRGDYPFNVLKNFGIPPFG